jgi:hypothetical protein
MGTAEGEKERCNHCHVELIPGDAYCHNCGAPTRRSEITQQPTTLVEPAEEAKQAIMHAETPAEQNQEAALDNLPTIETNESDSPGRSEEKDGGA